MRNKQSQGWLLPITLFLFPILFAKPVIAKPDTCIVRLIQDVSRSTRVSQKKLDLFVVLGKPFCGPCFGEVGFFWSGILPIIDSSVRRFVVCDSSLVASVPDVHAGFTIVPMSKARMATYASIQNEVILSTGAGEVLHHHHLSNGKGMGTMYTLLDSLAVAGAKSGSLDSLATIRSFLIPFTSAKKSILSSSPSYSIGSGRRLQVFDPTVQKLSLYDYEGHLDLVDSFPAFLNPSRTFEFVKHVWADSSNVTRLYYGYFADWIDTVFIGKHAKWPRKQGNKVLIRTRNGLDETIDLHKYYGSSGKNNETGNLLWVVEDTGPFGKELKFMRLKGDSDVVEVASGLPSRLGQERQMAASDSTCYYVTDSMISIMHADSTVKVIARQLSEGPRSIEGLSASGELLVVQESADVQHTLYLLTAQGIIASRKWICEESTFLLDSKAGLLFQLSPAPDSANFLRVREYPLDLLER